MNNRERELYLEYMRQHPWARASYALALAQALAYAEERKMELPKCASCNKGVLLPLSDYGPDGSSVKWKAWACSNKACGFGVRIDKGQLAYDHVNTTVAKKTY
jgi:hypothetical protein